RVVGVVVVGGGIGLVTGGFFLPQAAAVISNAAVRINTSTRTKCFIVITRADDARLRGCPRIYFDQSGWALFPTLVICFRSCPVREMVKICDLPDRVDMNARWRPFGAHDGLSFDPSPN